MSTHTKYVGEKSNIVLQSCTFGLSPTYVDNHRYALVEFEKSGADKKAIGCFPRTPLFCWESVSFVNLMQGLTTSIIGSDGLEEASSHRKPVGEGSTPAGVDRFSGCEHR
ncbi:hypothetical protein TNCV_901791 [Trichonephila clavipes]|nr:hypothetical protein TNCV_901791 [Trichonephila clavipes]